MPDYLMHVNMNHDPKTGQFTNGDGDGDGIIDDHHNQNKSKNGSKKRKKTITINVNFSGKQKNPEIERVKQVEKSRRKIVKAESDAINKQMKTERRNMKKLEREYNKLNRRVRTAQKYSHRHTAKAIISAALALPLSTISNATKAAYGYHYANKQTDLMYSKISNMNAYINSGSQYINPSLSAEEREINKLISQGYIISG